MGWLLLGSDSAQYSVFPVKLQGVSEIKMFQQKPYAIRVTTAVHSYDVVFLPKHLRKPPKGLGDHLGTCFPQIDRAHLIESDMGHVFKEQKLSMRSRMYSTSDQFPPGGGKQFSHHVPLPRRGFCCLHRCLQDLHPEKLQKKRQSSTTTAGRSMGHLCLLRSGSVTAWPEEVPSLIVVQRT